MSDTINIDNPTRKVNLPSPRTLELLSKQKAESLIPDEEGELRGLFAHPDNPLAQSLVKNEYLASLGLSEMPDEDRERLRQIRAQAFRRQAQEETRTYPSEEKNSPADTAKAWTNELHVIHTMAKLASLSETSWSGSAKAVIDSVVADIPDNIAVYTKDTLGSMPKDEPAPLELYFLSRIRELPKFEDIKPEGALGVVEGMRCLRDRIRTKKFVLGVKEAIQRVDQQDKEEINMVDAGCGAIPIMAIYAALSSDKVRCTAIELNPNSVEIARQLVASFNLQERIQIVQGDATQFQPEKEVDFLISETMHSGLSAEPMVQIMSNLSRYVKPEGVILPSHVSVQTALIPLSDWTNPEGYARIYGNLHHYVKPEWVQAVDYKPGDGLEDIQLSIPTEGRPPGSYLAMVTSEVDIGSQKLAPYQSLITMPQILRDNKSDPMIFDVKGEDLHRVIAVRYKPGDMLDGKAQLV